jgi:hypothetical protein
MLRRHRQGRSTHEKLMRLLLRDTSSLHPSLAEEIHVFMPNDIKPPSHTKHTTEQVFFSGSQDPGTAGSMAVR